VVTSVTDRGDLRRLGAVLLTATVLAGALLGGAAPTSAAPGRGAQSLDDLKQREAEAYSGALDRASLRRTPGLYTRAWRIFRANKVSMTALVILVLIVVFVLSAPLISRLTGFE